jgi:hypothetical protein
MHVLLEVLCCGLAAVFCAGGLGAYVLKIEEDQDQGPAMKLCHKGRCFAATSARGAFLGSKFTGGHWRVGRKVYWWALTG